MKQLATSLLVGVLWLAPVPDALAQAPTEEDLKEMRQAEQLEKQQERSMPGAPAMETQTQIAEPERPEAALERNDFPWLGVDIREFSGSDRPKGLQVTQIGFDSPAAKAGIKANDLILAWDGKELKKPEELSSLVQATPIGKTVEVKISRNGTIQTVKVTVESLLKAAERGNVAAQYRMGNRYLRGEGVAKDPAEAVRWFRQAADRGYPDAMYMLGYMYERGEGLAKDRAEAARWVFKALEKGDDFTVKEMTTNAGAWNINFRKALQMQLRDAGLYMGAIDGKFGPAVKRAIGTLAKREQQE